ncbi:MAG: hypothetical protein AAF936_02560 [Pseudomonadota bacterium]
MKSLLRPLWPFAAVLLATGCVSYPYETAFSGCDAEAGVCYRYCEDFEGTEDYSACHADCEFNANQCFAGAYDSYQYSGAGYGARYSGLHPSPWYGQYGAWYPNSGYVFSFNYFGNGYGYGPRRYRDRHYGYQDDHRRRRRDDQRRGGNRGNQGGGQNANPPPAASPPRPQPRPTPPTANPQPPQATPPGRKKWRSPRNSFPEGDIE